MNEATPTFINHKTEGCAPSETNMRTSFIHFSIFFICLAMLSATEAAPVPLGTSRALTETICVCTHEITGLPDSEYKAEGAIGGFWESFESFES